MQAIEGDGSPWSYLSASILRREAAEFGPIWHGCVWSDQTILSKPTQQADGPDATDDALKLTGDAPVGNWTWHGAVPRTWKPTYADRGTTSIPLPGWTPGAKAIADDGRVSEERILHQALTMVGTLTRSSNGAGRAASPP